MEEKNEFFQFLMNITILYLHYQLLELFHEFLQSSADNPYILFLKKPVFKSNFISALKEYSQQSQEIHLMADFFYLKVHNRNSINFFLFFRDLVLTLRVYEVREALFLEEISLKLEQWPQILKGLCAWDKGFLKNMEEIHMGFQSLYQEKNGRFNKQKNSINSLDLLELFLKILNPKKKDFNKNKKENSAQNSIDWMLESPKKDLNLDNRINAKFSSSTKKNLKFSENKERFEENKEDFIKKIKGNYKETKKYCEVNCVQISNEKKPKEFFIKPPNDYYRHLLKGSSFF